MTKRSLISLLAMSTALVACESPQKDVVTQTPVPVLAVDVGGSSGGRTLSVGMVRGTNSHEIGAEHGGRVVALYANVGDRVRRGQVLARLDSAAFRAAADQARANLNQVRAAYGEAQSMTARVNALAVDQAQAGLQQAEAVLAAARSNEVRLKGLVEAGVATQAESEQAASAAAQAQQQVAAARAAVATQAQRASSSSTVAQARQQVEGAEAQYRLAQRNLSLTTIVAPADGVIGARHASLSALVPPGGVLFSMDGDGALEIEARIPGAIADTIRTGDIFTFRSGAQVGRARLVGFSRRADGVDVRQARFVIVDGTPATGVAVELMLPTGRSTTEAVSTIPLSAVIADRGGSGHRVYTIANNGQLTSVPVEIVEVTSLGAEVRGAVAGQKIVAAGAANLSVDRRVRPVPYTF
jgi:multidrug resistance efflux pump